MTRILQSKSLTFRRKPATTRSIPVDNTVPQIGESEEVFSVPLSPQSASSYIVVDGHLNVDIEGAGGDSDITVTLHVDGAASATRTCRFSMANGGRSEVVPFRFILTSGSTTARTYSIRYATRSSLVAYVNREQTYGNLSGPNSVSSAQVYEVLDPLAVSIVSTASSYAMSASPGGIALIAEAPPGATTGAEIMSLSATPESADSRILILFGGTLWSNKITAGAYRHLHLHINGGSSVAGMIYPNTYAIYTNEGACQTFVMSHVHSPGSTDELTIAFRATHSTSSTGIIYVNRTESYSDVFGASSTIAGMVLEIPSS